MINKINIFHVAPLGLTVLLIIWTIIVSPYSKYGDNWAIVPAIVIFLIIIILHIVLLFIEEAKINFIIYGLIHIIISFAIWIYCLMKISKDSL